MVLAESLAKAAAVGDPRSAYAFSHSPPVLQILLVATWDLTPFLGVLGSQVRRVGEGLGLRLSGPALVKKALIPGQVANTIRERDRDRGKEQEIKMGERHGETEWNIETQRQRVRG